MKNKSKISLPIYENWIAFIEEKPCQGHSEFELFSDARITGENTSDFGPYKFINTVPCSQKQNEIKAYLVLRIDNRLDYSNIVHKMDKTDTSRYHGGNLNDEIAAITSLAMGIRVKAGKLVREFRIDGDKFGRPCKWQESVISEITPEYGRYKILSVLGEHNIVALEPLKFIPYISEENCIPLIKASRLYQQALWIAENDPSLSWVMLVSAIETAANQWRKKKESTVKRLEVSKPKLNEYLISTQIPNIVNIVASHISDSLGATQKFVDFILEFFPQPTEKRPPEWLQHQWNPTDIKKTMKIIYNYRSKALHGGTPFPYPMCKPPYYAKEFDAPGEKPYGLGCSADGGIWNVKDTPMLLNTFEYIVRNCLLTWWKSLYNKNA